LKASTLCSDDLFNSSTASTSTKSNDSGIKECELALKITSFQKAFSVQEKIEEEIQN